MELSFLEELLVVFCTSLATTLLFRRIQLPPIVAYIVAGVLVGPYALGLVGDPQSFALVAEFGVAFLLFSIGLEFSFKQMMSLRFAVFGLGALQVIVCSLVFAIAVYLWGSSPSASLVIAGALALSSTAIVSRELADLQQFNSRYAQLALGVLLFQDLIAVLYLILLPVLGTESATGLAPLLALTLGKGVLLFTILMATGKWVLPRVYHEVAKNNAEEVFVLSTLVIVLLAAWLTHWFGLSMALGGFVVGMMMAETSFKHQIEGDIRPFKDILMGLFFVSVGMNIDLTLLQTYWFRILVFTLGLIVIKTVVVAVVVRLLRESSTTALRVGITLGQAGEFGLALIALAHAHRVVPSDQTSFVILIATFTMMASPVLIRHSLRITRALLSYLPGARGGGIESTANVTLHHRGHVIVGGFGRVGQTLVGLLEQNNIGYIAVDKNISTVSRARKNGKNVVYGDSGNLSILKSCHIETARLAVLTFGSLAAAKHTISRIREDNIDIPIIVRCHHHEGFEELISVGANHVVPEMLEASLVIGSHVLSMLGIEQSLIDDQLDEARERVVGRVAS